MDTLDMSDREYLASQARGVLGSPTCYEGPATWVTGGLNNTTWRISSDCTIVVHNAKFFKRMWNSQTKEAIIVVPIGGILDIKGRLPDELIVVKTMQEYKAEEAKQVRPGCGCIVIFAALPTLAYLLLT